MIGKWHCFYDLRTQDMDTFVESTTKLLIFGRTVLDCLIGRV